MTPSRQAAAAAVIRTAAIAVAALSLVALAPLGRAGSAAAQEVTLTVHHFLSAKAVTQAEFLEPWAARLEEASEGRLAFEFFPSMAMGGAPPELYQQARDGVADIIWTVLGYTPGVFPRASVFNLPSVHGGSATVTNLAIRDLMDSGALAADFADVHPLLVHVHSGQALHTTAVPVRTIDDVRGLKLRVPSRSGTWMIEAMGAEPVSMPVPELPQALSRGVLDGAFIPFEVARPLRVIDIACCHTELAGGQRFGTTTFLLAMNKDRYESLPDDLRAILDAHTGPDFAREAGRIWDTVEPQVMDMARQRGNEIIRLSPAASAPFLEAFQVAEDRWLAEAAERGLDGAAVLAAAKAAVARHADEAPE
ncbi:TRAP transporter substrate-binding protein [Roseospira goensis]|uniref:TRAP-type C4-dicarboxylate transport system substrate-binding protein n=1 Tax=Roseospira goensis TaxID=391922 RepID=A0A7W6RZK9_9PROT|nr:TRAP transporter substrate-binding protein [Roseospira goensis]MBB4286159.1 TRAP-type C4-dicarboxylate transport system substrate-binding protein [Roseospira goensis]